MRPFFVQSQPFAALRVDVVVHIEGEQHAGFAVSRR